MGIFDNYENLNSEYIPNNLSNSLPTKHTCCDKIYRKPYEEYNAEGELVGYYWYYGDTVNLQFNLTGEITVADNAIIYSATGVTPTALTEGVINQKAYNVIDLRSWTLLSIDGTIYNWVEDPEFIYPTDAPRNVYFSAENYLKNKLISISLYNFRLERIFEKTVDGAQDITLEIGKDLSKELVKGIYYCSLTMLDGELNMQVIAPLDCMLVVK